MVDLPLNLDKSISDAHVKVLEEGVLLSFELKKATEVVLLNENLDFVKRITLPAPFKSTNFIGVRETNESFFVYRKVQDSGWFMNEVKIDKTTFDTYERVYPLSNDGLDSFANFVLDNEVFSIRSDQNNMILKILRSSKGDDLSEYSYKLSESDIELFRKGSGLFSTGSVSMERMDKSAEHSIYNTHEKYKFFTSNSGGLILTIDGKENSVDYLRILTFTTEPEVEGYSRLKETFMPRVISSGLRFSANSFIHNDMIFSVGINEDAIMLDILDLDNLSPIKSFSSVSEEITSRIKPNILYQEGALSLLAKTEKSYDKPKKIMSKIRKGQAGIVVADRGSFIELTIGSYVPPQTGGGTWVGGYNGMAPMYIPSFYSFGDGVTYFYRVKLDPETLESLGSIDVERDIDKLNDFLESDKSLKEEAFLNGRILFEMNGAYYIGYQQRDTHKYKIWKAL
ncbi:hypothetical protein GCM10011340_35840 [Roseivirga thermotolerans]|uniref:Uncharacterized protein n=2 Tax=Roseivirga thermotolerans TaxID=1758176 RepID=A0ABQ3I9N0_9BACT|nr:hypothetical protein GCM10011340_35840 [Roseivirga thermotolerans]